MQKFLKVTACLKVPSTFQQNLHNVCFMYCRNCAPLIVPSKIKSEIGDAFRCLPSDEFDALHNSVHNLQCTAVGTILSQVLFTYGKTIESDCLIGRNLN